MDDQLQVPDYAAPFVGWRAWLIATDGDGVPRLRSVVMKTLWPAREPLVAECGRRRLFDRLLRREPHEPAPRAECRCGVYATTLSELEPILAPAPWASAARVLGQVSLWGDVVECERGWRASRAYPARLYVPLRDCRRPRLSQQQIVDALRDYGVPVVPLPCRPAEAIAYLGGATPRHGLRRYTI